MNRTRLGQAVFVVAALVAASAGRLGSGAEGEARADEGKPAPAAASCALRGSHPIPKGTTIHDAASGGRVVASFTGAHQALVLTELPADPTVGRARVSTSHGGPGLRVDGWVAANAIPVFAARDLTVAPGHVWIADAQRVRLVAATAGGLTAELGVPGTGGQTVRATVPCESFALQPGAPTVAPIPGDARGWLTRGGTVELFDAPAGTVILALRTLEGTAQLFWSNESRAGFVRVRMRAGLVIDAWVRQRDLEPLKKGEMMDQFLPPTTAVSGASLKLDGEPRVMRVVRDLPLRAKRDEKDQPIGVVEAGAEVYVLETMLGFTNLLPRNLGLTPGDDGGFWVPTPDLLRP